MILALNLIMVHMEANEATNGGQSPFLTAIGLDDTILSNLIAGFFGGLVVGLYTFLRAVVSSRKGRIDPQQENHTIRAICAGLFVSLLFGVFGGIVATYFTGVAGSFITGLTALGLIASIVGDSLQKYGETNGI